MTPKFIAILLGGAGVIGTPFYVHHRDTENKRAYYLEILPYLRTYGNYQSDYLIQSAEQRRFGHVLTPGERAEIFSRFSFVDAAVIYPTLPGTGVRDFTQPGLRIEGDRAYPTLPGTSVRNYSGSGGVVDGNTVYPTLPGTSVRDYTKPGVRVDGDMAYPTIPGTGIRDYSQPGIRITR